MEATEMKGNEGGGIDHLAKVTTDVFAEISRQRVKWGEQNHNTAWWLVILGEEYGEACEEALNNNFSGATSENYRKEMVQLAAVALSAIESLDRQGPSR